MDSAESSVPATKKQLGGPIKGWLGQSLQKLDDLQHEEHKCRREQNKGHLPEALDAEVDRHIDGIKARTACISSSQGQDDDTKHAISVGDAPTVTRIGGVGYDREMLQMMQKPGALSSESLKLLRRLAATSETRQRTFEYIKSMHNIPFVSLEREARTHSPSFLGEEAF